MRKNVKIDVIWLKKKQKKQNKINTQNALRFFNVYKSFNLLLMKSYHQPRLKRLLEILINFSFGSGS